MKKILVGAVTLLMLTAPISFAGSNKTTKELERAVRKMTRARDTMLKVEAALPPGPASPEQIQLLTTISALSAEIQSIVNNILTR